MHFDLGDGEHGMTLRDYFAAKAMQGLMSCPEWSDHVEHGKIATQAYWMADAMLKARDAKA